MMHGAQLAFELLGDDYVNAMSAWFEMGAFVEQGPGYFVSYTVQGDTATVEFAAGSMEALRRAARGAMAAHGLLRVRWSRAFAGKHSDYHDWDLNRIVQL